MAQQEIRAEGGETATFFFFRCGTSKKRMGSSLSPLHLAAALVAAIAASLLKGWRPTAPPPRGAPTPAAATPPRAAAATPHIVVVGGGLAGASAALAAADALRRGGPTTSTGRVTLLDKEGRLGGNSAKASSGVSAVTRAAHDTVASFAADLDASAGGRGDPALRHRLAAESEAGLAWLEQTARVALTTTAQLGGHAVPRTHGPAGGAPVGWAVMQAMAGVLASDGRVGVVTGRRVVGVAREGGRVVGVTTDDGATTPADAVVLATGGYSAAPDLLPPSAAALPTTNGAFATGDGLALVEAAGGVSVDLDAVQLHPTAFEPVGDTSKPSASLFLAPERLRGVGGVLLNGAGERFVDELEKRSVVASAVTAQPGGAAWLLLSPAAVAAYGEGAIGFYVSKGLLTRVEGVAGVAAAIGARADVVAATLAAHDAAARGAAADTAGRKAFASGQIAADATPTTPFVIGRIRPAVHYTMGGAAIDTDGRVLRKGNGTRSPVPGLYAAGEVAGGVHGANRLGGCSLLDCVVFGRAAGAAAVGDWVQAQEKGG